MLGFTQKTVERQIFIPSKTGDPQGFDNYFGQDAIKRRLLLRLSAMDPDHQLKALFYAPFGYGKTALARALAHEMFRIELIDHYKETIGTNFMNKADVDEFILSLKPYTLVFIDEIHTLPSGPRESFYTAIQDNVHVFQRQHKMVKLPVGISWVGATTELGQVHPSLQRRLIPINLEPLTQIELANIVVNQRVPVTDAAAVFMAKRSSSPWEIKDEVYSTAEDIVVSRKLKEVSEDIAKEGCEILQIDEQGLRPQERRILDTLFKSPKVIGGNHSFAMARTPLISISGVDAETYNNHTEPKLMRLGLIRVSSAGRELTGKALDLYYESA